ncbi:hypothetical protein HJB53_30600 [Rhizobium lentis]|uniref:hypothetical protein n=1 Tax=Rhizobium lentis TaxID=1138194 RepID=UPI001C83973E|nr:hypothetical protein [Rhizobium lentis]MBX5130844.1 hypothetical protein [Rhizobium lentis]
MQLLPAIDDMPRPDPIEDDLVAFKFIDKKLLAIDPELFRSKWFDYRMMTPLQATRHYIEAFGEVYRDYFAVEISKSASRFITVPSVETIMKGLAADEDKHKMTFSGMWRGRQVADAIGMPYKDYIHTVMGLRLRFWSHNHLPQASHLYKQEDVEKTVAKWEEMQAARLYLSDDPGYMIENYRGIAHQDDYHEWLFKQASLRGNPWYVLATFINQGRLPLDKVEARFDPDMVERVHRYIH